MFWNIFKYPISIPILSYILFTVSLNQYPNIPLISYKLAVGHTDWGESNSDFFFFKERIIDFMYLHHYTFLHFHTIHEVLQARIMEWVAISSCSGPHFVRTLHSQQESETQYLGTISKIREFNIIVIQVYTPTNVTEEAEVDWFYEDLPDLLELTLKKWSSSS